MSAKVTAARREAVGFIVIDNPPVNAIAHPVRAGLLEALESLEADSSVQAIVIHGAGREFIAGADIRELDAGPREPLLNDVLLRIEACRKPVIAALHGSVLGGGCEVALASHYRCATPDARIGLPEVKLGLLPGSGGTQRLPRLVGVRTALDLMISGEPIGAARARELGIVDRILEGAEVEDAAFAYARELIAAHAPPRRVRELAIPDAAAADAAFFKQYRESLSRKARSLPSVERIIQCVEAAVSLPFDAALARSRVLFEEARRSTESAALRHLFLAERGRRGEAVPRPVQRICVLGAGTMGSGIAVACATSGFDVSLVDSSPAALESGIARVASMIDGAVAKGRLTAEQGERAKARISAKPELQAARDADLVIEAVFESMQVKQEVFSKLDDICRTGAVLATNTSTLDVDAIAAATRRPADVVGMHFFSPANVMRLIEIVRGRETAPEVISTVLAVGKRLGKVGVVVGNCFGFVGNRMLYAYGRENQLMLLEGAAPERIDRVLEQWGMAMGPNAVSDLAGLDVGYRARRERKDRPGDPRYYRPADLLVEQGRLGQKVGRGFYRYEGPSRQRQPDPEVVALIRAEAERLGVKRREHDDAEIVERCIYALINEGARILEEGIASSPTDIDVIWCNGYGFPRTRGGPMFYADTIGLGTVLKGIRRFGAELGSSDWQPAPLLERLVDAQQSFRDWHAGRTASQTRD